MKGIDSSLSDAGLDGQRRMHLSFELVARLARDHTDGEFSDLPGKASFEAQRLTCLADHLHERRSSQQRHERTEYGLAGPAMMASAARCCASLMESRVGIGRRSAVPALKPCGVVDAGVGLDLSKV